MVSLVGRSGCLYPYLNATNFIISRPLTALAPAAGDALVNQRKSSRSQSTSGLLHGTCTCNCSAGLFYEPEITQLCSPAVACQVCLCVVCSNACKSLHIDQKQGQILGWFIINQISLHAQRLEVM